MKNLIIFFLIVVFILPSCDKGFEELNRNPSAPTNVNPEAIFNELVNSLRLGWNRQLFLHNEMLYDVTELGVVTASTFGNTDAGTEDVWSNYYQALRNARQLKVNLDALATEDLEIGDIIKAQVDILMAYKSFQLIDLFGDVPYFEAGKAYAEEEAIIRPPYDSNKEIYLSLINDLRSASDFLATVSGTTSQGSPYLRLSSFDALFNDNLGRWASFSNSMLLKYLVRIYDEEPDFAAEGVAHLINSGYNFVSAGNDVVMLPRDQAWSNLGVNWSFREHNKLRLGSTMWNLLTENGEIIDPRLNILFETNNDDEWVPFPQISDADTPQSGGDPYQKDNRDNAYDNKGVGNIYSSFNFYLVRDEQDIPEILMTGAEVKFIFAEVFLKGIGVPADEFLAAFRYQEGMLASLNFWQDLAQNSIIWENKPNILNSGELFQVTEHPKYKFEVGGDINANLEKIYTQRWLDYFRQPWEAFSILRRTNMVPREKPVNNFYRFQYPNSERNFNFDNWSAQVDRMGGDETNVKTWWHQ